ncbi:CaiB/BaiF CoA transferase family protein [Sphingobium baderi]|uniref:Acyl-CoA hydratase n=1 Tax=Sphingobium baderi TaxID=1332080 RepID=A0A0S3EUJ4_9SPHN|nr:CaiB/BaiF CoA-transferase family protein [Sphingobium baderi]ALR19096.1 acyl-CoA hydratase [Sphingobium baderi]AMT81341.1 acyl-CoA hydratase [Sphingobium baderi]ARR57533.1 CoA transferase [Rhizorhabdus wittichii DC-6]
MLKQPSALEGLRVLDLTRLLPGAFATQILADMGADVLKIEHPVGGDYNRSFEPIAKVESGSFLLLNRNKKSLTLNLKTAEGKEVLRQLAADADVLVEGFRPGVMDRLGLSYDDLSEINPRLIYCAISGYGQTGPWRLKPGHDLNYLAEAGALQLFGKAGEGPIVPGLSIADMGGGSLMATTGILAAVTARARTGQGQFVDISMHDGAIAWLAMHGADTLFAGIEPKGGERPFIGQAPCYNVYECACGGFVALGAIEEHFWRRFCDAFGVPELGDQQWPVGQAAQAQKAALQARFLTKSRDVWVAELEPADIPFGPVLGIAEALHTDHARAREMLTDVDHPVEGRVPQIGFPVKLSETPCAIRSAPPQLGEHTAEVLAQIGYDAEAIEAMRAIGAV